MKSIYSDNPFGNTNEQYKQMPYHLIRTSAFANQPMSINFSRGDDLMKNLIPQEQIEDKIYLLRGKKVMLDRDLAELYGVTTSRLNEQVRRNKRRFPDDFMFQLNKEEFRNLISQNATSSWGGTRKLPLAFTENGVAMLSGVLNSTRAVEVNIQIMRTFTTLRRLIDTHKEIAQKILQLERKYEQHDFQIQKLFDKVRDIPLLGEENPQKIKGFTKD